MFAGIVSAFVDNVATVLMIAPVALAIAKKFKISPVAMVRILNEAQTHGSAHGAQGLAHRVFARMLFGLLGHQRGANAGCHAHAQSNNNRFAVHIGSLQSADIM